MSGTVLRLHLQYSVCVQGRIRSQRYGRHVVCLTVALYLMLLLAYHSENYLPFTQLSSVNKAMSVRVHCQGKKFPVIHFD